MILLPESKHIIGKANTRGVVPIITFWLVMVLLLLSLPTQAKKATPFSLEWETPTLRNDTKSLAIRFKAETFPYVQNKRTHINTWLSGEVIITGSINQLFIICAHQADSADLVQTMSAADNASVHSFRLEDNSGTLAIKGGSACPETINNEYPYHVSQRIRSKKPFLVIKKQNVQSQQKQLPILPLDLFRGEADLPTILSGATQGFDDYDFKYPPFMPVFDKNTMDLLLLPVRLPDNWRDYLPFTGLYYWLAHQQETPPELTLLIRFNGADSIRLRISRAEYSEMAENLLNAQQLLYWLTSKLNGREAFVHRLLELQQLMGSQELDNIDDIASRVRQQLTMVLEQPQTAFSLEFETDWFASQFPAGLTLADKPDTKGSTKITFGQPSPCGRSGQKETPGTAGSDDSSERCDSDGHLDKNASADAAIDDKGDESIYVLWVNGIRFYLRDKKIQNDRKKYRDLTDKQVTVTNDQGTVFPLSEIERQAGLPEPERLYQLTQQGKKTLALDYLLYYGDPESLRNYFYKHTPASLSLSGSEELAQSLAQEIKHNYPQKHRRALAIVMSQAYQRPVNGDLKQKAPNYTALLFYCAGHELIATTDILLQFVSAQPDLRFSANHDLDSEGNSLLHAGAKQSPRMMQVLLNYLSSRPNRKNRAGYTPMHVALKEGKFENARLLYDAGSNPDITAGYRKKQTLRQLYPPSADEHLAFLYHPRARKKLHAPGQLIAAIEENSLTGLLIWLENAPDIDAVYQGKSPIQMAAGQQRPEFIKILFLYHRYQQLEPVICDIEFNDLRVLVYRLEAINGVSSRGGNKTVIYESAFNSQGGMLPLVKSVLEAFLTEYLRPLVQTQDIQYIISQLVEQHHLPVALLNLDEASKQAIQKQCFGQRWKGHLLNYQQFITRLLEQESMEKIVQLLKDEPDLQLAPVTALPFSLQVRRIVPEIARVLYDHAQQLAGHHESYDLFQSGLSRNPNRTPVALACAAGSLPVVDMLLNLQGHTAPESKPLHIAVEKRNRLLVLKLLANGIEEKNAEKRAALIAKAKANGDTDIAKALEYKNFAELFSRLAGSSAQQGSSQKSNQPLISRELLHIAVETGEPGYVDWLLSRHIELDGYNGLEKTPLESALDKGYTDIARKLLERDQSRQLFDAVRKGKIRLLRQLAKIGSQFDALQDSCSLLYTAVENNQVEITRWLLDRLPARFIAQSAESGHSPLTLAKARHLQDIIELLEHSGR